MGQQQMLLIIVGVIIISIAIAVGIELFGATSISSNKDAIINDMNNIAADAYQYRVRLKTMGGGGGSYAGYKIPSKLQSNDDAGYSVDPQSGYVTLTGISSEGFGSVVATIDSNGNLTNYTYSDQFK